MIISSITYACETRINHFLSDELGEGTIVVELDKAYISLLEVGVCFSNLTK